MPLPLQPTPLSREQLDSNFAVASSGENLKWYDARQLQVIGQGWTPEVLEEPFARLPARAKGVVRDPVWQLSRHSAGIEIRFSTDSDQISLNWTVVNPDLAMDHMPATGVSGLDLYVKYQNQWKWLAVGRATKSPTNNVKVIEKIPKQGMRDYRLYLPLYNGIQSLQIGVSQEATFHSIPSATVRPIVVYGSSIVQGGCASRPGMTYPALLGRWLNVPVINLGFSGNGQAEPEVAQLLAELDPQVFVLDTLPNIQAPEVLERVGPLIAIIRKKHPKTPLVMVESITYQNTFIQDIQTTRPYLSNQAFQSVVKPLMATDDAIHYVPGDLLLGEDGEGTVDGVHPTDLGFLRMAQGLAPVIAPLLQSTEI
ncbi:MAG: SGNH/GDSL hydrolase family protein [Verrucomicrobiota bacterium]